MGMIVYTVAGPAVHLDDIRRHVSDAERSGRMALCFQDSTVVLNEAATEYGGLLVKASTEKAWRRVTAQSIAAEIVAGRARLAIDAEFKSKRKRRHAC